MTFPNPIDAPDKYTVLAKSDCLTGAEVLARRSRRIKQLHEIYRENYWVLAEEVRTKHRDYWWEYGKSPAEDVKADDGDGAVKDGNDGAGGEGSAISVGKVCAVQRCGRKALAMTSFCRTHIVRDARQMLYKPCEFLVVDQLSGASEAAPCGNTVSKSVFPSYCDVHYKQAEEYMTSALKKAGGTGNSITLKDAYAPKFHVLIAEYVKQIQQNRRATKKRKRQDSSVVIEEVSNI